MAFGSMTIKSLESVNPDIDQEYISLLNALYVGGKSFEKYKDQFIILRQAEVNGKADLKNRMKRAQYINRAAGLIFWAVSVATKNNPTLESEDEYWKDMNKDCDGNGTPFSSIVSQLIADMLVSRWPYVEARNEGESTDPLYTINRRDPQTILDYQEDEDGQLVWIKTKVQVESRSSEYSAPDRKKVIVTYYTDTDTVSYSYYKKGDQCITENGQQISGTAEITPDPLLTVYGHEYGEVPIYRGNSTPSHWIMDRVSEPLKAIYNTEVDLSFGLAQCAYAQLIFELTSVQRANSIVRSESGAWVLEVGEKAYYLAPPNTAFDGLFKNIDRLKDALHESLQMMAKETVDIPQAGRMSGDAVREHRRPVDSFIVSLSYPIEDMLNRCLAGIAKAIGKECPKIVGFGSTVDSDDMEKLESIINGGAENNGYRRNQGIITREVESEAGTETED